jgi:hypothetical protein
LEDDDALILRSRERVGSTLRGKWRLDDLRGVGGMAAVYAATHRNGARSAIKLLHVEVARSVEARERFSREAYIANSVGHEGAVAVLDDDVDDDGSPFLVMELLEGQTAAHRAVGSGGRLAIDHVLRIASATLAVLEQAHGNGVVHRDIKPDNLFLTTDGSVKVLDFGIARLLESSGTAPRRTRTGVLLGTPGYMAPEQALGRTSEVDARTDLWAVGATMFNLLTGRDVHLGETGSEQLVHTATRPAPSLARVMPEAPLLLVQIVDRALAFDADRRYPDAAAMRADVDRLIATGVRPTIMGGAQAGAGRVERTSTRPSGAPSAPTLEERLPQIELYADVSTGTDALSALRELLKLLEKTMLARVQYGAAHKEAARRFDAAYRQALAALDVGGGTLAWNVSPYAFVADKAEIWEPKAPLDAIPYRLFADGLRTLSLHAGLEPEELDALLQIWMRDPAREIAPEDDLVTLLWDADFAHIGHEQLDSYAEGDQEARARFEAERQKVVALASFDTGFQLQDCWQQRTAAARSESFAAKQQALIAALDAEAAARAASMPQNVGSAVRPRLEVDEHARGALAVRMGIDMAATGERFVLAAARAFVSTPAEENATAGGVLGPLRAAARNLSTVSVPDAIGFVCALCKAVEEVSPPDQRERTTGRLADALVSRETLESMLGGAASEFADDLAAILRYLHAEHLTVALDALPKVTDARLLSVLLGYVERCAAGHEADLGALLEAAPVELALALVRILVALGTPASRAALVMASRSQHPVVRIEALGHLEGVASDRLRLELKRLIEDAEPAVRLATLVAIAAYRVKAAGPAVVLRIRSVGFDGLAVDERRQSLETLCALMPARAEAVCIELLSDGRVVTTDAHERTRELAAEVLARQGTSQSALDALATASKGRWRNSDRVRAAATKAVETFERRVSQPPPAPSPSIPPGPGTPSEPPRRPS